MKTELELIKDDDHNGGLHFRGTLSFQDYPELQWFDRKLIEDCSRADATPADHLMALECLFRRAHEQATRAEHKCDEGGRTSTAASS